MQARIIENWLDSAIETTFQKAFCFMLTQQGFTVTHMTRHCGMELGKDVIAVASDGTPCCFQLKTSSGMRIGLKEWKEKLHSQMRELVELPIIHHSVPIGAQKRCFFVTNRCLEEEVTRAIDDMNRDWQATGHAERKLEIISRGQMLEWSKELEGDLWPDEPFDTRQLIDLYYQDGEDILSKEKLAIFFESFYGLDEEVSKAEASRKLSSSALLCSIASSAFVKTDNHVAIVEAWTMYLTYAFAAVERWELEKRYWEKHVNIALSIIYSSLENLREELSNRTRLVEGNAAMDIPFYRPRITHLIALMSVLFIWRRLTSQVRDDSDASIEKFIGENIKKRELWGEAAIPQYLAHIWYLRFASGTMEADLWTNGLLEAVAVKNSPRRRDALATPYYLIEDLFPYILGLKGNLKDAFQGKSHTLESILHLSIRRNYKQALKLLWARISKIHLIEFQYSKPWDFYRWRTFAGKATFTLPPKTEQWDNLKAASAEDSGASLTAPVKQLPHFVLLFLICFPHRLNSSTTRWLDSNLIRP